MKNNLIIFLFLVLSIGGCATKPMIQMEKDVSLKQYKSFEVLPVTNETGKTFKFDVAHELTQYIKTRLKEKRYVIVEGTKSPENVLVLKGSLIAYKPGSAIKRWLLPGAAGKTQATVRTKLIDKKTGQMIGELVSVEAVGTGGLFSIGADKWVLDVIAQGLANEIEEKIKSE